MLKAGITGNIGSGKSTVARIFATLGIPVYDADTRAKWLMEHNPALVANITDLLGAEAYAEPGRLNRPYISQKVFHDKTLLQGLNALVHPAVFKDFDEWVATQQAPYVLKEAALLVESGSYKDLDVLMVVTASEETRLQRCMKRDGASEESIRARMKNQLPESQKTALAQFVINNENQLLIPQVIAIHEQLLQQAAKG